jgi:hypothetical protein
MDSVVNPTKEPVGPKLRPLTDALVVKRKIAFCQPDFLVVKEIRFLRTHGSVRYKTTWLVQDNDIVPAIGTDLFHKSASSFINVLKDKENGSEYRRRRYPLQHRFLPLPLFFSPLVFYRMQRHAIEIDHG